MIKSTWISVLLLALPFLFFFSAVSPVSGKGHIEGAWRFAEKADAGEVTHVLLFSGSFFSHTAFMTEGGAFLRTKGGMWSMDGANMKVVWEFDTADSTRVGSEETWGFSHMDSGLWFKGSAAPGPWKAMDEGVSTPLTGPWLFSGRERDGEITRRDTNQPRKTMKLLSGNRFQWIAYNTETKQFSGTGGGSYTAQDGKYIEKIEFFSRDNKRVGASLEFQFNVDGDDWHHKGKSTAGEEMYEIWSRRVE